MPQSIVESEELQHVLNMDNYDEEKAIQNAIELSLGRNPEGSGNRTQPAGEYNTSTSISSSSNRGIDSTNHRSSGAKSKAVAVVKRRTPQNGGNRGQMSIDPWLSIPSSSPEPEDRSPEDIRKDNYFTHPQHTPGERSRRTSFGRSRFDYEPMALMSTSATESGLQRSETPGPIFTSPRKQAGDVIEVDCSDQEDSGLECGQAWSQREPNDWIPDNRTSSTTKNNRNKACLISSSSPSSPPRRLGKKRLVCLFESLFIPSCTGCILTVPSSF